MSVAYTAVGWNRQTSRHADWSAWVALAIVFAAGLTLRRDPLSPNPGLQWEQLR